MASRQLKDKLYPQFARVGSALASGRRLELIDLLAQAPRHVEALAAECGLSLANVSQHLQILKNARLVESERIGTRVVYRLADENVARLWLALRDTAESQLAEVAELGRQNHLGAWHADALSFEDLEELDGVMLIDVRPKEEYDRGHIPGATSIPLTELQSRAEELPRDQRIVLYCRSAYCHLALEALDWLRERGFDVAHLAGGWLEWPSRSIERTERWSRRPSRHRSPDDTAREEEVQSVPQL